jgi:transcriptional regulator with XRE-family HTH domain
MSQQDLADTIGVDQKQIWRYETDRSKPYGDVVARMAQVLDTSTDWLLGMSDEIKPIHSSDDLSDEELRLLNIYRSKSPEGQQRLLDVAKVV